MLRLRRVVGESMRPALSAGKLVVAVGMLQHYRPGDVVIVEHGGRELIKRITDMRTSGEKAELFLRGDNPASSTDSREFGWLPASTVKGRVIWPMKLHKNLTN